MNRDHLLKNTGPGYHPALNNYGGEDVHPVDFVLSLTVDELRSFAADLKIKGRSEMAKDGLVWALLQAPADLVIPEPEVGEDSGGGTP